MKAKSIVTCLLAAFCVLIQQSVAATDGGKLTIENFKESLVPKGFVLSEEGWHIWCNSPIFDARGKLHLFVSRWPVKDTFGRGWHTSCEIAHPPLRSLRHAAGG